MTRINRGGSLTLVGGEVRALLLTYCKSYKTHCVGIELIKYKLYDKQGLFNLINDVISTTSE